MSAFNLTTDRAELLGAVTAAARIVERRTTIPILGMLRIDASREAAAITGTNLDVEVRAEIDAEGAGSTCVSAARLRDILRATPGERVEIAARPDGKVRLSAAGAEATFMPLPAGDFPELKAGDAIWSANLPDGVFAFTVGGVADTISTEETRYYLNGVYLEGRDGVFRAVATDGHRLTTRFVRLDAAPAGLDPIILPRDAVKVALPLVGKSEAVIRKLQHGAGVIEVVAGRNRIRAKAIDGTYPDWRRVVPADPSIGVESTVGELRRAVALAKANSSERGRALKLSPAEGGIRVSSDNRDEGEIAAQVACSVSGAMPDVGLNVRYFDKMVRAVERMGSRTVRLGIVDAGSPVTVWPDAAIDGAMALLMPMRV